MNYECESCSRCPCRKNNSSKNVIVWLNTNNDNIIYNSLVKSYDISNSYTPVKYMSPCYDSESEYGGAHYDHYDFYKFIQSKPLFDDKVPDMSKLTQDDYNSSKIKYSTKYYKNQKMDKLEHKRHIENNPRDCCVPRKNKWKPRKTHLDLECKV